MSINKTKKSFFGLTGESAVCTFLLKQGFTICTKNFSTLFGEIDIIAEKKELLVMVEVKTRSTNTSHLTQLVTPAKQKKIIKTAALYQLQKHLYDRVIRFDVALVVPTATIKNSTLPWQKEGIFSIAYFEQAFCSQQD